MAVKGRAPPSRTRATGPAASRAAKRGASSAAVKKKQRREEDDRFDGSEPREPRPTPPARAARGGARGALSRRTLVRLDTEIRELELEIARVIALLAAQGLARAQHARHRRTLDRLRERIERARKKLSEHRRGLLEDAVLEEAIAEADLERVEAQMTALERCNTDWAKALGALEVAKDLGPSRPRRVSVRGADAHAAMDFAAQSNPTTLVADLAASALALIEACVHERATAAPETRVGPTLSAERKLARLIDPGERQ